MSNRLAGLEKVYFRLGKFTWYFVWGMATELFVANYSARFRCNMEQQLPALEGLHRRVLGGRCEQPDLPDDDPVVIFDRRPPDPSEEKAKEGGGKSHGHFPWSH
ncbi:unnamed protein product [Cyprideis torosa]|uniref:Uncharacterized protein n=1 Tax=Cyprideis torosa TaxID=163714 RepID=A0A7R8ZLK7_9CRUS|nr:unnamed protein product [Cyprideis torosa]CAG0883930.1 unnamed protein product [Cyprideis torosa]